MHRRRGYTIIEFLTTVAVLIVVFGVMVSLARHVRSASADEVTRDILHRLSLAMAAYALGNNDHLPDCPPLLTDERADAAEPSAYAALKNNRAFLAALKSERLIEGRFDDLSIAYYDNDVIRDAWGSPIVFMPHEHPAVGMTSNGWFFFSAGPDRQYLTRDDNHYSYDQGDISSP